MVNRDNLFFNQSVLDELAYQILDGVIDDGFFGLANEMVSFYGDFEEFNFLESVSLEDIQVQPLDESISITNQEEDQCYIDNNILQLDFSDNLLSPIVSNQHVSLPDLRDIDLSDCFISDQTSSQNSIEQDNSFQCRFEREQNSQSTLSPSQLSYLWPSNSDQDILFQPDYFFPEFHDAGTQQVIPIELNQYSQRDSNLQHQDIRTDTSTVLSSNYDLPDNSLLDWFDYQDSPITSETINNLFWQLPDVQDSLNSLDSFVQEGGAIEEPFIIESQKTGRSAMFKCQTSITTVVSNPRANRTFEQFQDDLRNLFSAIHAHFLGQLRSHDKIRMLFTHPSIEPLNLPFGDKKDFLATNLISIFERMLQSKSTIDLSHPLSIDVTIARVPSGGGNSKRGRTIAEIYEGNK